MVPGNKSQLPDPSLLQGLKWKDCEAIMEIPGYKLEVNGLALV